MLYKIVGGFSSLKMYSFSSIDNLEMAVILLFKMFESLSIIFHSSFSLLNDEYGIWNMQSFLNCCMIVRILFKDPFKFFNLVSIILYVFEWGNHFNKWTSLSKRNLWLSFCSMKILCCLSDWSSSLLVMSS